MRRLLVASVGLALLVAVPARAALLARVSRLTRCDEPQSRDLDRTQEGTLRDRSLRMGQMDAVMMQLSDTVSDKRGTFHALVMARERNDGRWEGWLEFVPADKDSCRYATPIETRQHDRVTMERWASGLTVVYADGALARARTPLTRAS